MNAVPDGAALVFRLPESILDGIIGKLKSHHRAALRGSCRKFRSLVNAAVTKIKLDPTHSEDALRWQLHTRFPRLEHIEVIKPSEVDCFTDQTFAQLALKDLSRLRSLSSLNLENCTQLTVAGVAALALACPGLGKLVIPQVCQLCMSDSMLLVLSRLPDLSRLRVQCCRHCDEVALAYLSDLRCLTALELEDYGQALRQVTQLTSLISLRSVMVWSDYTLEVADGVNAVGGGHHGGGGGGGGLLHHMHLNHMHDQLDGAAEAALGGGTGLGALAGLAAAGGNPNPVMAAVAAAAAAAAVANLNINMLHHHQHHHHHHEHGEFVQLDEDEQAEEEAGGGGAGAGGDGEDVGAGAGGGGLGGAAVVAAAIQNLDAAFAHQLQVTEQVLSNIFAGKAALLDWVTGMTGLTHIDIQRVDISCPELQRFAALPGLVHLGVGDLSLEPPPGHKSGALGGEGALPSVTKLVSHNILHESALRTTFPSLRALSCDSTDTGLRSIAELTGLVNLFLWTSPSDSITDGGLASLSVLGGLETFRLEGSEAVSDGGWVRFAAAHGALTRVDLVKCPGVTDIGFILSIKQLCRLQRISFVECPGIDTPTLAALLAFCTDLEYMELQDCPAIALATLRSLLATVSRPDLEVVFRRGGATRTLHGSW